MMMKTWKPSTLIPPQQKLINVDTPSIEMYEYKRKVLWNHENKCFLEWVVKHWIVADLNLSPNSIKKVLKAGSIQWGKSFLSFLFMDRFHFFWIDWVDHKVTECFEVLPGILNTGKHLNCGKHWYELV